MKKLKAIASRAGLVAFVLFAVSCTESTSPERSSPGPAFSFSPSGVTLNPAGRVATAEEVSSAPKDSFGNPIGFRTVFLQGDSRSYDIIRTSEQNVKFLSDLRSSLGLELRVQMPVINVPFRLIFAYNPQAKTDLTDPTVLFIERKTAIRFSVGRTF